MPVFVRFLCLVTLLISVNISRPAFADNDPNTLVEQEQNNVFFLTGGIGDEERDAMENVRRNYNVHIINSRKDGAFSGDTTIIVYDRTGNTLLSAPAGPLFYATLPDGKYVIASRNEGQEQKKTVRISGKNPTYLHFMW